MITDFFSYDFLLRALVVGIAVGITAGILGNFIVASRNAIVSDMLAHSALAGVGIGIFLNIAPALGGGIVTVIGALLLWQFRRNGKIPPEAASMLIMTGSLALAVLFSHLAKNNPISLETYLFGSILTVTQHEVFIAIGMNALILLALFGFWNRLRTSVIDPEFARSRLKDHVLLEAVFMVLIGMLVAVSLKIIGGLLIGALLVIPVLAAQAFSRSFLQSVGWSILINISGITIGLLLSFVYDVPSSSAIVLTLIAWYLLMTSGAKIASSIGKS